MATARTQPPLDVAVLCCIPLDAGDWVDRAGQRPCGDFVRFVSEARFKVAAPEAWTRFAREAAFVDRKLQDFEQRGLSVTRRAAAADIARSARHHRNVVVIAHWKGIELPSDNGLPCSRLETEDAMLTAEEFAGLFPDDFAGTVYMIVCTSDIPAETFRRKHRGVICICSNEPALAGLSVAKLDAALQLMAAQPLPLWKALLEAGDIIDSLGR